MDNNAPSWTYHLEAELRVFDDLANATLADDSLHRFCEIWLIAHYVMRSTASQDSRPSRWKYWTGVAPMDEVRRIGLSITAV